MRGLLPLWNAWQRAYLRWAMSEIDPMHPDVPQLAVRLATLEARR